MGLPFYVYMLRCGDGSFYVGHSDDLEKRMGEHRAGGGCAHTSKRLPVELVWSEEYVTREEAKAAEARVKGWSRAKKQALIRNDFAAIQELARKQDWVSYRKRRLAQHVMQSGKNDPEQICDGSDVGLAE